ncbi:MAG: hypothetical protein HYU30_00865 [Chloroflexi bacterium]|nr:hypothetical protein [Chloroflexota bacterium]
MLFQGVSDSFERGLGYLTDPRFRRTHGVIIVVALVLHLATHYATYFPQMRQILGTLPYFRLHAIHEAEFLLIVVYAGIVFGMKGGLLALLTTVISSIPFIFTPYIFGRSPQPNEIRDLVLQVAIVLTMGFLIVLLYGTESRRRRAETQAVILLETDAVKNEFLSMASNAFRMPLTTLYGFSELLLTQDVSEERRREWLERIHKDSERLSKILDDLLTFSRVQSGRLAVRREKLEISLVIQEMMGYVSATTNRHTLKVDAPPRLPPVVADKDKLTQVFVNFLSNAIKYSPKGGQITISVSEDTPKQRLVVGVADQGIAGC